MATDPIEELYIALKADPSGFLDDTKRAVGDATGELRRFEQSGKQAFNNTGKAAQGFLGTVQKLQAAFVALGAVVASIKIGGFFVNLAKGAVAANSQFEVFRTQFETLLGSQSAAQQRIEELAKFGIETPFELPEVVQASKLLQTFGGTALATGENLRMIGDIAAGVNQPFADVAMWVGRMYDAMQSGRPFGEASMRLQEMGALSGQARAELEKMQKEGASGAEMWAKFNDAVGSRFAGNMGRLAETLQGITSNLVDFRDNLIRVGGQDVFEQVRQDAKRLLDIISDKEMSAALQALARAFGQAGAAIEKMLTGPALDALEGIDPKNLKQLGDAISDLTKAVNEFLQTEFTADLNGLIDALTALTDLTTATVNDFNNIKTTLDVAAPIVDTLRDAILNVLFPVKALIDAFGSLRDIVAEITGKDLGDFSRDLADSSATQKQVAEELSKAQQQSTLAYGQPGTLGGKTEQTPSPIDGTVEATDEAKDKLEGLFVDLLDQQEEAQAEMEQLDSEHAARMIDIDSQYVQDRLELGSEMTDELEKLEADVAKKREKILKDTQGKLADLDKDTAKSWAGIITDARDKLAKLEGETDQKLADERESFQQDELRETEDHLRDMRRLREDYLYNLEDAVGQRDARAIVDLRRRFQQESQQREEDFQTQQGRRREDQDQRLAEIRDNERERSEEILAAREKELEDLRLKDEERRAEIQADQQEQLGELKQYESERRAEIDARYQEDLTKLDEKHAAELGKEIASYSARQAELDSAMAKRLESIATSLATEEKINEESAVRILETLAKYFGEEGEIDKLMSAYQERATKVMKIKVNFDGGEGKGDAGGPTAGGGDKGLVPQRSFAAGGSMLATRPTLVQFGEVPELAQFTPLSQLSGSADINRSLRVSLEISGSAPPGIRAGDKDQIAGVVVQALRDAGMMGG